MKKLLSVLFSIAFLLVFVSFFSQKTFASCSPACAPSQTCVAGILGGYSCSGPTCAQACASASKTCGTASGCNCGSCSSSSPCTAIVGGGAHCVANKICTPGNTQCSGLVGGTIQTCNPAGTAWTNGTICSSSQKCMALPTGGMSCINVICTPGAAQCSGNTPQSCNSAGTGWTNGTACASNQTCIAPPGGAVCQTNLPTCKNQCASQGLQCGTTSGCTNDAGTVIPAGSTSPYFCPNNSVTTNSGCPTSAICTAIPTGGASCQFSTCKSRCASQGLQCGTVSGCTNDTGTLIPAGSTSPYFCPTNSVTTNSGCPTGAICTAIPTGGASCQAGNTCTPSTGACQQIDANHCGNVGRQPTTCGLTTTWSSCTITPQKCEAPNTCNTSGICVPPTPTAPILGTGTCTGTTANLSWTNGTGTSTNAYYCDQTKAAAAGGCKPDDATINKTRWFSLVNGGNNKSPLSVTGLTLGDTYQWLVAGITGATHINSSIGTFTCSTTPPVCTLPKFYPHFACQNNTCVSVATCDNNDTGCTAAGGTCGTQPGDTVLSFVIGLDGVGTTGDNVNPAFTSGTNTAIINGVAVTNNFPGSTQDPVHKDLDLTVLLLDSSGSPVTVPSAKVDYDTTKSDANYGKFLGTLDLGTSFTTGDYTVKVTVDGHLRRTIQVTQGLGTIQTITAGQTKTLSARLVAGDVDSDNALTIKDYNILMSCMPDVSPDGGTTCRLNANYATRSHLLDNSTISSLDDYDLFLREYSVQNGD